MKYAIQENYFAYLELNDLTEAKEYDITNRAVWSFISWLKDNYYDEYASLRDCIDHSTILDELVDCDESDEIALSCIAHDFNNILVEYFKDHLVEQIEIYNMEPADYE
jgi:hypothetical protein